MQRGATGPAPPCSLSLLGPWGLRGGSHPGGARRAEPLAVCGRRACCAARRATRLVYAVQGPKPPARPPAGLRRRVGALGSSGTAPRAAAHAATVARRDMWLVELLVGDSHTHGPKRLTCNINPERRPAASLPQSPRPPPLAYGPRVPGESARASRRLAELPAPSRSDDSLSPRSGRIAFDCI